MLDTTIQWINSGERAGRAANGAGLSLDQVQGLLDSAWCEILQRVLPHGSTLVILCNGHFSERLAELARGLGHEVDVISAAWGEDLPLDALARRLGRDLSDEVDAVLVLQTELSTGVRSDLAAVRPAMDESFHEALLLVDASRAADSRPIPSDLWGADLAVLAASGKYGSPVVALGDRLADALPAMQTLSKHDLLHDDCSNRQVTDCDKIADSLRHGLVAMGLGIVARHPRIASSATTTVRLPQMVNARDVIDSATARHGVRFEDGLGDLAGQVVCIDHGCATDVHDCLAILMALGRTLEDLGAGVDTDAGLAAALARFGTDDRSFAGAFLIAAE